MNKESIEHQRRKQEMIKKFHGTTTINNDDKINMDDDQFEDIKAEEDEKEQNLMYKLHVQEQAIQEKLYQKQQEFDMQTNMKMDKFNELLMGEYNLIHKRNQIEQEIKRENQKDLNLKPEYLDPIKNKHLQRVPLHEGTSAESYVNKKKKIYNKLKDTEIREIFVNMKNKYGKYDATKYTVNMEEFNKLKMQHDKAAYFFYNEQPSVEYIRSEILYSLGDCHTMLSCLNNLEDKNSTYKQDQFSQVNQEENRNHSKQKSGGRLFQDQEDKQREKIIQEENRQKQKLQFEQQIGDKMRQLDEEESESEYDIDGNEIQKTKIKKSKKGEKDINKPKIYNFTKEQISEKHKQYINEEMNKKEKIYKNSVAQIFEDDKTDITVQVKNYFNQKYQDKNIEIDDNDYEHLLPENIDPELKVNYFE